MNKFFVILSHTYKNRVKSKAFIITTVLTLAAILIMTNIQTVMDTFSGDGEEDSSIAIIAEEPVASTLTSSLAGGELFEGGEEEGKEAVLSGEYEALLVVDLQESGLPEGHYYTEQLTSSSDAEARQVLQQIKTNIAAENQNLSGETLTAISSPVAFERTALEEGAKSEEELNQARVIVYIMLFVMYFAVIMYGNIIATEVTTEKSSRVMEILVSSVSPVTQMFAKITGIALLGLTQFALFILVGYLGITLADSTEGSLIQMVGLSNPDWGVVGYAVLFFILGYFLYATLAAMLGSLVSRVEDAQQTVTPMMMMIIVAFFLAISALGAPEATYIVITSYIPFFTPFVMFTRMGMVDVALWETLLSLGILVGTILLLGFIGARIYRGGVLMYGKASLWKNVKEALQLSKKE
ncbi:ABC transporter permease [Salimicrobium halophilum]|uniref:ABC-2 type transport system permease protein n=1 Tax=Salimicrobium halophilum TaxID=86666 RepID=A0A1G8TNF3_9BACI|nr:ABC transporter permease [Salimicrobium halophilum]SDJ42933.1 ABC-2 type transport system permease protein [Salimicrobium halophilum]